MSKEFIQSQRRHEHRPHILLEIDGGPGPTHLEVLPDDAGAPLDDIVLLRQSH